jgi:hypothetical protein
VKQQDQKREETGKTILSKERPRPNTHHKRHSIQSARNKCKSSQPGQIVHKKCPRPNTHHKRHSNQSARNECKSSQPGQNVHQRGPRPNTHHKRPSNQSARNECKSSQPGQNIHNSSQLGQNVHNSSQPAQSRCSRLVHYSRVSEMSKSLQVPQTKRCVARPEARTSFQSIIMKLNSYFTF